MRDLKKNAIVYILVIILTIIITILISGSLRSLFKTNDADIDNTFISNKLEEMGELTSAQLIYNGIISYSDGKIPFINKKSFLMTYRAEVEAGIQIEDVGIKITDNTVQITLPQVEILDIYVVSDSIQFFDESFSLFNHEDKKDVIQAISIAEADVCEKAEVEELKVKAKAHTELLMQKLFESSIGNRELVITYKS